MIDKSLKELVGKFLSSGSVVEGVCDGDLKD